MSYMENLKSRIRNARKVAGVSLETKDGTPQGLEELKSTISSLTALVTEQAEVAVKNGQAIEELRATNDRRLEYLEKRGSSDVLDEEKLGRINEELNRIDEVKTALGELKKDVEDLSIRLNRPESGPGDSANRFEKAHKKAFDIYARKADEQKLRDLDNLETRDAPMVISDPSAGGYAVPEHLDRQIMRLMREDSPMRRLATVISVGTSDYKKLVNKGGTSSGWVGETDPRDATDPSKMAEISPVIGEVYAYPGATQHALDDIYFDVEGFIRDDVYDQFADEESIAFVSGNGTKKPKGFLTAPLSTAGDKNRAFGTVQKIASGAQSELTADVIIQAPYQMKSKHRRRAVWLMNSVTIGKVRLLKDNQGRYLWRDGMEAGTPNQLNGLPVEAEENMPDVAAGTLPVALGNWKRAYAIIDRTGIRFLRDPLNKLGYVYFYFTKRVGGHFIDTEAFKVISIG